MIHRMESLAAFCHDFEMDVSYFTERAIGKIKRPTETIPTLDVYIGQVRAGFQNELRKRLFMFMPAEQAKYFNESELFGPDVSNRFPRANKEITEAGNCYATGNNTACVFHLMRAVEVGARCMVSRLKVQSHLHGQPIELCDWGTLVAAIQKGVDTLSTGTRINIRKKKRFEFYNHALGSFRNFKDAWRNHVSHTRELYLDGQTKDIIDNTRQFMTHLARELKEPKSMK